MAFSTRYSVGSSAPGRESQRAGPSPAIVSSHGCRIVCGRSSRSPSAGIAPGGVVHPFQQRPDRLAVGGLAQGADEAIVAQTAGDVFQGAEMVARPILRRNQQDKHVDGLAIEAIKVDAA